MSYNITNTAGNLISTVNDGTVDTSSTSISLIGNNYVNYSQYIADDLVAMLENFANNVPPNKPMLGQLWFNSTSMTLQVFNGTTFNPINAVKSTANAPVTNTIGDLWFNSSTSQLNFWDGMKWVIIAPLFTSSQGKSGLEVAIITDESGLSHTVLNIWLNDVLFGVFNNDSPFSPLIQLPGFSVIQNGINFLYINGTITNSLVADELSPSADALYVKTLGNSIINGSLTATNLITGNVNITGNVIAENNLVIDVPGELTISSPSIIATGNITAHSLSTGNIDVGNIYFSGSNTSIIVNTEDYSISSIEININNINAIEISSNGNVTINGLNLNVTSPINLSGGGIIQNPVTASYIPTNPTDLANKEYVDSILPIGTIVQFSGLITEIPPQWALCNGLNGTPDLRDTFVIGAGGSFSIGQTGGENLQTTQSASAGNHAHTGTTNTAGQHNHTGSTGLYTILYSDLPEHVHMYLNTVSLLDGTSDLSGYYQYPLQPDLGTVTYDGIYNWSGTDQLPRYNTLGYNTMYSKPLYDANGTRVRFWQNGTYTTPSGNGYPIDAYPYSWSQYPSNWQQNTASAVSITASTYPAGNSSPSGHSHVISNDGNHSHLVSITSDGLHYHTVTFDNKPQCLALAYIMKVTGSSGYITGANTSVSFSSLQSQINSLQTQINKLIAGGYTGGNGTSTGLIAEAIIFG